MQPQYNSLTNTTNKTIYINPNFQKKIPTEDNAAAVLQAATAIPRNAHINPLFLGGHKHRPTIHMNPAFYLKFQEHHTQKHELSNFSTPIEEGKPNNFQYTTNLNSATSSTTETRKIICKSKNRLIREPLVKNVQNPISRLDPLLPQQSLLVLNKRKLIRKAAPITVNTTKTAATEPLKRIVNAKSSLTKYKLDNRVIKRKSILPPTPKIKRTSFVGRYALRRTSLSLTYSPGNKKTLNSRTNKSSNMKLQLLNINGVLYKSTRNSLKLREMTCDSSTLTVKRPTQPSLVNGSGKQGSHGLTIFVSGTKYIMDSNKFKLTRVTDTAEQSLSAIQTKKFKTPTEAGRKRIDIGGYTYILASSAKNVFVRSTNHLARAYVHNAKQKSLQLLTKRLAKSNIPCPIYQRVGKCAAFERGKCSKVHNKLQVAICSKFLRGECLDSKCLLSHNITLSKMPVCKFFLQGVCVRNDCPYLHKKLSNNAEICIEFLRGFCQLADKCNKRHEFVCPQIERNISCSSKNCIYCKSKQRKEKLMKEVLEKLANKNNAKHDEDSLKPKEPTNKDTPSSLRYFVEPCDIVEKSNNDAEREHEESDDMESSIESEEYTRRSRPKLGALPAFIPL